MRVLKEVVKVNVDAETRVAKGEVEMTSSHFIGRNLRWSGAGLLTFTALLVLMVSFPALGTTKLDGVEAWANVKDGDPISLGHFDGSKEVLDKLKTDDIKPEAVIEAMKGFAGDSSKPAEVQKMVEAIGDAFVAAINTHSTTSKFHSEKLANAIFEAIKNNPDAFGSHFDGSKTLVKNSEGMKELIEKVMAWLKDKKNFQTSEEDMAKFLSALLKDDASLRAKLGFEKKPADKKNDEKKKKKKKKKSDGDEDSAGEAARKAAEAEAARKAAEQAKGAEQPPANGGKGKEQPGTDAGKGNNTPQLTGEGPSPQPCLPAGNDDVSQALGNLLQNMARTRPFDPTQGLLGLEDRLNGNRGDNQGQPSNATPPITPNNGNNNDSKGDPTPETAGRDLPPPVPNDPRAGETGVQPMQLSTNAKDAQYREMADKGDNAKADLSAERNNAKQVNKKLGSFLTTGVQQLSGLVFMPNGMVNPNGFAVALGTLNGKLKMANAQSSNLQTSIDTMQAKITEIGNEMQIKAAKARKKDSSENLANLTKAAEQLTMASQAKANDCKKYERSQNGDKESCESAKAQIDQSLARVNNAKTQQEEKIKTGDEDYDDTYITDLKRRKAEYEADIKAAQKDLAAVGEIEDKLEQQINQLNSGVQIASANATASSGNTTAAKLQNGGGGRITAQRNPTGPVVAAGAGTVGGVGRPSYGAGGKGSIGP